MEALAVIAGVVGLVWGVVVFTRGGLLGGCMAVMLAVACFSVPFFKIEIGPMLLTADRLLLVLLVAQYILWRRWGLADPKPIGKPEIVLLVFAAMLVVSTFTSDWTIFNYQPTSWLIINYLMPVAVYWIARQAKISERAVLAVFGCLAVFGVYLAVTALAEYFKLWWLVFPKYIVTTAAENKLEFIGRGRGPLLNPIGNGVLLAICLGSMLLWWPRLNRVGQLALMVVSLLFLAAIYSSMTRSVWMGGALVLAMAVGLAVPWSWRWPLFGSGLVAVVLVVATQWEHLVTFKRDKSLTAAQTADSVSLRPILAVVTWHMFLDRPLFGCGYSQYKAEHWNYVSDRSTNLPLERGRGYIPHNVLFSLLAETGLLGLGLFLTLLFLWTRDAWRLWRDKTLPLWAQQQGLLFLIALGVYLTNGMFHEVSVVPLANMTLFFLAGVTAGLRPLTAR